MKWLTTIIRRTASRRFAFLRWPVDSMRDRVAATRQDFLINRQAVRTAYPLRAVRYWWVLCALQDELRARRKPLTIADVGCSKGNTKLFVGDMPHTKWIGLDWSANRGLLTRCGYHDVHSCNFDQPLPLADHSVDVVIFLHVIEHLPRPEVTMRELSRILRPGGILLAGSPVAPRWAARYRQRHLRRELDEGVRKAGKHINSLDPGHWCHLVSQAQLETEVMTGTCLVRWSGFSLENHAWWLRLNQVWGALFPSLGNELYVAARKPEHRPMPPCPAVSVTTPAFPRRMPALARLTAITGAIVLALLAGLYHSHHYVRPFLSLLVNHVKRGGSGS